MIKVKAVLWSEAQTGREPAAVFAFEDAGVSGAAALPQPPRKRLVELAKAEGFKGSPGEVVAVDVDGRRWLVVGLGKKKGHTPETPRRAAGALASHARSRYPLISVWPGEDAQAVAEGLMLASYRFEEYKKPETADKLAEARLVVENAGARGRLEKPLARALLGAEAVTYVRDLVNRAPSDKTPKSMGEAAQALSGSGVTVKILEREDMEKLGMGSLLGVARGSTVPPVLVHLRYKPKTGAKRKIALVGKGITFDSGGLSLKPPASMETMKMDMAGAATVLGLFKILPRLGVKAEVDGYCAFTYNMPGPDATKPGDVVRAMNGKTIEVLNTDAEGRLILADALSYALKQEPDAIIDLATLTGAVLVALGSKVTGAMGNSRALMQRLMAASVRAQEPFCELPLFADYKDHIKSGIADLQNIGKVRGEAGSIIGGLFLEEFVDGKPWVHLDIAGTAWNDHATSYCPAGGTGSVVRTLMEYLVSL